MIKFVEPRPVAGPGADGAGMKGLWPILLRESVVKERVKPGGRALGTLLFKAQLSGHSAGTFTGRRCPRVERVKRQLRLQLAASAGVQGRPPALMCSPRALLVAGGGGTDDSVLSRAEPFILRRRRRMTT
jgi:hypothetical protein